MHLLPARSCPSSHLPASHKSGFVLHSEHPDGHGTQIPSLIPYPARHEVQTDAFPVHVIQFAGKHFLH